MTESAILTHLAAAFAGGGGIYFLLRYVAGWATSFEASVKADLAIVKHTLGIGSAAASTLPPKPAAAATPPVSAAAAGVPVHVA